MTAHPMTRHARGVFTVTATPQPHVEGVGDPGIDRMALHKRFEGDMVGEARGQMLAFRAGVEGSAGYVAMDVVEATIEGRHGSFVLQHGGTMDRGAPQLLVSVVPDSGTGALAGIRGTLAIEIRDGRHFHDFTWQLPVS